MTVTLRDRAKVGRTQFLAVILAPQADGYPDTVASKAFLGGDAARAKAVAWAGKQMRAYADSAANVYEQTWEPTEGYDHEYGRVLDADTVNVASCYGWRDNAGTVTWDEWEPA
jgi:hypothetical protein